MAPSLQKGGLFLESFSVACGGAVNVINGFALG